ncbi:MAG: STT3 domain-containing protein [Candidatus Methanospirareceae archaeon]
MRYRWGMLRIKSREKQDDKLPPNIIDIPSMLLLFCGFLSIISLIRTIIGTTQAQVSLTQVLDGIGILTFPIAYGVWRRKREAFYAAFLLLEILILLYPLAAAFSPHFKIPYNPLILISIVITSITWIWYISTKGVLKEELRIPKNISTFNILYVTFGIALFIRAVLPYGAVFRDTVRFAPDDAVFHMRLVENALFGDHFPRRLLFDAYTYFPHGSYLHFAPLFDEIIIFATWLLGGGSPTKTLMEAVGAYYPAILGALVVFPVYIIGREIYNRYAGLIAAVLVAILPGQFLSRSIIGFTDHHVGEVLFSTVAMMFFVLAIKATKKELLKEDIFSKIKKLCEIREYRKSKNLPFLCYVFSIILLFYVIPWEWWVFISFVLFLIAIPTFSLWKKPDSYVFYTFLAGMALGYYLLVWVGGLIFVFIIFVYGILQCIVNGLLSETKYESNYIYATLFPIFLVSLIMLTPFILNPSFRFYSIDRYMGSLGIGVITFGLPLIYNTLVAGEKEKERRREVERKGKEEYICPICNKRIKGIGEHIRVKHRDEIFTQRKILMDFLKDNPELRDKIKLEIAEYNVLGIINKYNHLLPVFITLILLIISVAFFPSIIQAFGALKPSGGALTIAEVHPMDLKTAWMWFTTSFFIAFPAMLILGVEFVRKREPEKLILLTWSLIMVIMIGGLIPGVGQNRFAYYYAVNAALLTGFFAAIAFKFLTSEKKEVERVTGGKKKGKEAISVSDIRGLLFSSSILIMFVIGLLHVGATSLVPLIAIVAIFLLWMRADKERKPTERPLTKVIAALLITFLIFFPFPLNVIASKNLPINVVYAIETAKRGTGANEDWVEALRWMRNNTPDPGVDYYGLYEEPPFNKSIGAIEDYNYPPSAYGVMSWWDYGHIITFIGHRIPNANPFQAGIGGGEEHAPGACTFLTARSEEEANKILDILGSRYVVSDIEMAMWKFGAITVWTGDTGGYYARIETENGTQIVRTPKYWSTMEARLHFLDGRGMLLNKDFYLEPLRHYRLVHESPNSVLRLGDQDIKYVKVFEYVRGAKIRGEAPNGSVVEIATNITTNRGRKFVYSQRQLSNGTFEFIVPYSTEKPKGDWLERGWTNYDVFASPYKIRVGRLENETVVWDMEKEVNVSERDVMEGGVIIVGRIG